MQLLKQNKTKLHFHLVHWYMKLLSILVFMLRPHGLPAPKDIYIICFSIYFLMKVSLVTPTHCKHSFTSNSYWDLCTWFVVHNQRTPPFRANVPLAKKLTPVPMTRCCPRGDNLTKHILIFNEKEILKLYVCTLETLWYSEIKG